MTDQQENNENMLATKQDATFQEYVSYIETHTSCTENDLLNKPGLNELVLDCFNDFVTVENAISDIEAWYILN